jgi:hypothetical protein
MRLTLNAAVTHAFIEYWEYMETIRVSADSTCSSNLENSVDAIDKVLDMGNPTVTRLLKGLFGLAELKNDADFGSVISVNTSSSCLSQQALMTYRAR